MYRRQTIAGAGADDDAAASAFSMTDLTRFSHLLPRIYIAFGIRFLI